MCISAELSCATILQVLKQTQATNNTTTPGAAYFGCGIVCLLLHRTKKLDPRDLYVRSTDETIVLNDFISWIPDSLERFTTRDTDLFVKYSRPTFKKQKKVRDSDHTIILESSLHIPMHSSQPSTCLSQRLLRSSQLLLGLSTT
jgi:hypothetical protein